MDKMPIEALRVFARLHGSQVYFAPDAELWVASTDVLDCYMTGVTERECLLNLRQTFNNRKVA